MNLDQNYDDIKDKTYKEKLEWAFRDDGYALEYAQTDKEVVDEWNNYHFCWHRRLKRWLKCKFKVFRNILK